MCRLCRLCRLQEDNASRLDKGDATMQALQRLAAFDQHAQLGPRSRSHGPGTQTMALE